MIRLWSLELTIMGVSGALIVGAFSVAAAHELIHDKENTSQLLGFALLTMCSCPYFAVEHDSGHHVNVATPMDSSTARFDESFHSYYRRYLVGCYFAAVRYSPDGLLTPLSHPDGDDKQLFRGWTICVCVWLLSLFFGGTGALIYLVVLGASANTFLALANYIQHYGLVRCRDLDGGWKAVTLGHSWSTFHPLSNWLLFDLPAHGPHHADAAKKYSATEVLGGPLLPGGYLVMLWLPLAPRVWKRLIRGNIP
jgi:alkane 1-monooxygenase